MIVAVGKPSLREGREAVERTFKEARLGERAEPARLDAGGNLGAKEADPGSSAVVGEEAERVLGKRGHVRVLEVRRLVQRSFEPDLGRHGPIGSQSQFRGTEHESGTYRAIVSQLHCRSFDDDLASGCQWSSKQYAWTISRLLMPCEKLRSASAMTCAKSGWTR